MRIIYLNGEGVSLITPSLNCGLNIRNIAEKDTPVGLPYFFVDEKDIPTDKHLKSAWRVDFTRPDGFGIGADAWLEKQSKKSK